MRRIQTAAGLVLLFAALPAVAEEIVYFKTGQTIPVRSHRLVDGMIHLDLGDNNSLAFPEFTIERIESAAQDVLLAPSFGTASNRRVPTPQGSYPVQGRKPPERVEIPQPGLAPTPIETDPRTGLAFYRPQGHRNASNRKRMMVTGDMRVFGQNPTRQGNGETFTGTTQVGSKHIIGGVTPSRMQNARNPKIPTPVSLTQKKNIVDRPAGPGRNGQGAAQADGSGDN